MSSTLVLMILCSVFLVFEYCAHDLARLLDVGGARFQAGEVKCLLQQLLRGLAFLHSRWIIHRDLKLSNLLLTDRCASISADLPTMSSHT